MTEENGSVEGPSPLEKKIIKQIEYYFGDLNLGRDRFLQGLIKEDDGWVTLETMLKFNRLAQLSNDKDAIAAAMRKSDTGLIEVSEDGKKLRRLPSKPVPEFTKERKADLRSRSIYAKGFPLTAQLDELIEFFEGYGPTDQIQMRKDEKREFKGSCFVIYKSEEAAKKFIEAESVKFKDTELEKRLYKEDYFKQKTEERKLKREKESQIKNEAKKKLEKDAEEEEKKVIADRMTKGAILEVKGLSPDTTREDIKKTFLEFELTVNWVDLETGQTEGRLRFSSEGQASTAVEKCKAANEGKFMIKGKEVDAKVLEGEEELEHWKKIFESQKESRDRKRKGRDKHKGGKRSGYKGFKKGRKRSAQDDDDSDDGSADDDEDGEPSAKVSKAEDSLSV